MRRIPLLLLLLGLAIGCSKAPPAARPEDVVGTWKGLIKNVETYFHFMPDGKLRLRMLGDEKEVVFNGDYRLDTSQSPMALDLHLVGFMSGGLAVDARSETILEVIDADHLRYYDNPRDAARPSSFGSEHTYILERTVEPTAVEPTASPSASPSLAAQGWQPYDQGFHILLPGEPLEVEDPPYRVISAAGECQVEVRRGVFQVLDEARAQAEKFQAFEGKRSQQGDMVRILGPKGGRAVVRRGPLVYVVTVTGSPENCQKVLDSFKL